MNAPSKSVVLLRAAGITNGATSTANLDCSGFDTLELDLASTTSNNVTNNPSVLKLSESDDTVVTNFADVTAFVGDGTGGFTVPNWHTATADEKTLKMVVDLRHRKRYLKLTISPVTTQDFLVIANLRRGELSPANATDANVLALVLG